MSAITTMIRTATFAGVSAAVVLTAGCGNGLSPEQSGTFELTQVNGSGPPQRVAIEEDTTTGTDTIRELSVVDGSVSVSSDGSATLSISGRERTEADGSTDSNTNSSAASGTVEGGDLVLSPDSINVELYPFFITGTSASSSVITVDLERTETPYDVSISLRFEK